MKREKNCRHTGRTEKKGGRARGRSRNGSRTEPWYLRPGAFLYEKMPSRLRTALYLGVAGYFREQHMKREGEMRLSCRRFLLEELSILFWGLVLTLLAAGICVCLYSFSGDTITLARNPYGEGEKEQTLVLKDKKGSRSVSIRIEEEKISKKQKEKLLRDFFRDLKRNMRGNNPSLQEVGSPLCFDDRLDGYPFLIEYQPEDFSLVDLGGELGEEAKKIGRTETRTTRIRVRACYGSWEVSRFFSVVLVAPERAEKKSVYDKTVSRLRQMEEASRDNKEVIFPGKIGGVRILLPGYGTGGMVCVMLAAICPLAWILRRYYRLKEGDERRRKEETEDFPLIVHLLAIYMKAGLSFSSAVGRISSDYWGRQEAEGRTAFQDIAIMDRQLCMGVSQKEACISWGKRSRNILYQRLSAALIQILVKGSKEGDRMLEQMEREAFSQRIDRAREEGKMAETKLLFPMIVLLCLSMILVMFPALLQFQGF